MNFHHVPVLFHEVIEALKPKPGMVLVDGTAGGGGHSSALLKRILPGGKLIAFDQDEEAIRAVDKKLSPMGTENYFLVHSNFVHIKKVLEENGINEVNGILFDLGVSSHQLDEAERGFSYQHDAPLDMRMDRSRPYSACELVNDVSQEELARIIFEYGEERWAKRIAQFIVQEREKEKITTTGQLVNIIKGAIPKGARKDGPHPAKRTFQALRIAVNSELDVIKPALEQAVECLAKGGRIAVITFHSLEDRITKKAFQELAKGCTCPKNIPVCICNKKPVVKIITNKPILPNEEELQFNPRSRSAKLRVAEKI